MDTDFRKPALEDRDLIQSYYDRANSRSCEDTFANLYLWNRLYPTEFAVVEDMMVLKSAADDFLFPLSQGGTGKCEERAGMDDGLRRGAEGALPDGGGNAPAV